MGWRNQGREALPNLHSSRLFLSCVLVFVLSTTTTHSFLIREALLHEFPNKCLSFKSCPVTRNFPTQTNRVRIHSLTADSCAPPMFQWSTRGVATDVPIQLANQPVAGEVPGDSVTKGEEIRARRRLPDSEGQPEPPGPATLPASPTVLHRYSRGTRKRAYARVQLLPGDGKITVNRRDAVDYLQDNPWWIHNCVAPLMEVHMEREIDIVAEAHGGGLGGQSGAIMLAVAREIVRQRPELRAPLRRAGFLTVDARKVERKKFGLRKARKKEQYSKR